MTREQYIEGFIKKYGPELPLVFGGHNYVMPISYLAEHGLKKSLLEAEAGNVGKRVTGQQSYVEIPVATALVVQETHRGLPFDF
jgi:hypothetical protein